jgi:hypothetical protein
MPRAMHVAEFTLHPKRGHFEEVAEIHSNFAAGFLSDHPALQTCSSSGMRRAAWCGASACSPIATPRIP